MKLPSFSKRPAYSVLYITELDGYRLDVDKAGVVIGTIERFKINCLTTIKLADSIKKVIDNSQPLGKKTWVLYEKLPIYLLSIPTMQIEGATELMLMQALQFELEGLTGQSVLDSQLAYKLLNNSNDMSHFWLSQIGAINFEDVQKVLKKAGSQLAGLLHPAGLPVSLDNPEHGDWLRFESWSKQLVALRKTEQEPLTLELLSYESRQWQKKLDNWLEAQPAQALHSETLLSDAIQMLPDTHFQLFLNDNEPVSRWLSAWAAILAAKTLPAVPVLRYQSTVNADLLMMAGGGGVAVLICIAHLVWNLYQTNDYNNKVTELKKVETSLTALNKYLADDEGKKTKLSEQIATLKIQADSLPSLIDGLQHRPAQLLEALAKGRPDNLLLEAIVVDKDSIHLKGVSLDSTSANELVIFLDEKLSALGWSVASPSKTNMGVFTEGGPWEFEITLLDLGLEGFKKKPTQENENKK